MRLPKWIWRAMRSKRVHRCLAIAPFVLMLGIVLLFWIWNLVGSRAVIATSDAIADAGFAKSYFEYCNPGIPADDDVFQHPAMLDAERQRLMGPYISEMSLPGLARRAPKTQMDLAKPMDVAGWFDPPLHGGGEQVAGEALLRHFSSEILHLEKVADALSRPRSSWGISPDERRPLSERHEFFSITQLRGVADFASTMAVFELAAGEPKRAAKKVGMILDVEEHVLESNPTGLTILIARIGMANVKSVVWEGIMREAWLDEDLLEFDQCLADLKPQLAIVEAQKGELAFQRSQMLEALESPRKREQQDLLEGWDNGREAIIRRLRGLVWDYGPRGRWDFANARTAEIIWKEGILDRGKPRTRFSLEDLSKFKQLSGEESGLLFIWKGGSLTMANPPSQGYDWLAKSIESSLRIETDLVLLRTGIAIERYRRENGVCPEGLGELVPRFLSEVLIDPWMNKPLQYRKQPDGSPLVWSVGSDRVDEGGLPHNDYRRGDSIWTTQPIPGFTEADLRRREP